DDVEDYEGAPEELGDAVADLMGKEETVKRTTIGPVIAPPGTDREARQGVVDHLISDIEKAVAAGLADSPASASLRSLLGKARDHLSDRDGLASMIKEVEALQGLDQSYRA